MISLQSFDDVVYHGSLDLFDINVLCPLCPLAITSVQFPAYLMEHFAIQVSKTHMGGTMRLGARKTLLQTADCITAKLYVEPLV